MSSLQHALQELVHLLSRTSKKVVQENGLLVKDVCKKLKESLSTPSSSLLEALESGKTKKNIERYIQRSADNAVIRTVELADLDLRLLDVQHAEAHRDDQTRFRKGLGERSLGLQFREWEMQTFRRSRLDDLCKDPGDCNAGEGNITEFIKVQGFPEKSYVQKAIRNGTRLLLLDHLFGTAGASAVVSFAPSLFREVSYPNLKNLADSMRQNAWITGLMSTVEPWIADCWAVYDGQIRSRKRKRSECYRNEHTGREEHGRREGHVLAQTPVDVTSSQAGTEYHTAPQLDTLADVAAAASAQPSQSSQHVPLSDCSMGASRVRLNGQLEVQYADPLTSGLATNDDEVCNEQSLQSQCRPYAGQSCPQQTTANHVPLNGAQNFPPSRFDQGGMTIGDREVPSIAEQETSRGPASVFPNYGVYGDGAATGQVRTPAQQQIANSHVVPLSWRSYDDLNWGQGTSAQQAQFHSALDPPLDQFGPDGVTTGGSRVGSTDDTDWDWNYGIWLNGQL